MKVIIAGSRTIWEKKYTYDAIKQSGFQITEILVGGANGPDWHGELYAIEHDIPFEVFVAEWQRYGKAAGYKRNVEMAKYAEALIAVWDRESRGTLHMIEIARMKGLQIFIYEVRR